MSKTTLKDRFIEALKAAGEREVKRLTNCVVFTRKEGGYYYIGSHGSLRIGKNRMDSIPVSKRQYDYLLSTVV